MKSSTLTRFVVGQNQEVREGCVFFHAFKIVLMVTAQAAHGVRKQNIEPRMAFLDEKFNTLTFCAGSKSESL